MTSGHIFGSSVEQVIRFLFLCVFVCKNCGGNFVGILYSFDILLYSFDVFIILI